MPSTRISVPSQGETEVKVTYSLYRQGSPAGQSSVRFQLNNGRLQALDPIPPALSGTTPGAQLRTARPRRRASDPPIVVIGRSQPRGKAGP